MHGSTDGPENRKESKLKIHSQSLDDTKEVRLNQAIPSSDNPEVKDIRNIMGKGENAGYWYSHQYFVYFHRFQLWR